MDTANEKFEIQKVGGSSVRGYRRSGWTTEYRWALVRDGVVVGKGDYFTTKKEAVADMDWYRGYWERNPSAKP